MMKNKLHIILIGLALLTFVSCGGDNEDYFSRTEHPLTGNWKVSFRTFTSSDPGVQAKFKNAFALQLQQCDDVMNFDDNFIHNSGRDARCEEKITVKETEARVTTLTGIFHLSEDKRMLNMIWQNLGLDETWAFATEIQNGNASFLQLKQNISGAELVKLEVAYFGTAGTFYDESITSTLVTTLEKIEE